MEVGKEEITKLVNLILKNLGSKNSEDNKISVDFSGNGDIIIKVSELEKDSDGIIKSQGLPDKVIRKHTKPVSEEDPVNNAIQKAIAEWSREVAYKLGDVEWNSKTLS